MSKVKEYDSLLKPKTITIESDDGVKKDFVITKFGAVQGLKILAKLPSTVVKSLMNGDREEIEKILELKDDLMPCVYVEVAGGNMSPLDTDIMIDNHVTSAVMLITLGLEVAKYNFSDLGKLVTQLGFMESAMGKVHDFAQSLAMALFSPFSKQSKQRSKN